MAPRPIKAERGAPIVQHERYFLGHPESCQRAIEELLMVRQAVTAWPRIGQLIGAAHADEIERDTAAVCDQLRMFRHK